MGNGHYLMCSSRHSSLEPKGALHDHHKTKPTRPFATDTPSGRSNPATLRPGRESGERNLDCRAGKTFQCQILSKILVIVQVRKQVKHLSNGNLSCLSLSTVLRQQESPQGQPSGCSEPGHELREQLML